MKKSFVSSVVALSLILPALFFLGLQAMGASFVNGEKVQTTANLMVRQTPSVFGKISGMAPIGSIGTISCELAGSTACPAVANGYTWWYIKWDNPGIPSGWSASTYLKPSSGFVTIQSISPTMANNMMAGQTLSITGTGFTGSDTIHVGSSITFPGSTVTSGTITGTFPAPTSYMCIINGVTYYSAGTYNVWVTNANGTSNTIAFTIKNNNCYTFPPSGSVLTGIITSVDVAAGSFTETLQGVTFVSTGTAVGGVFLPAGTVIKVQTTPSTVLYDSSNNPIALEQVITNTRITAWGTLTDITNKIVTASKVVFSQTAPRVPPPPPPPPPTTFTAGIVGQVESVNPSANSVTVYIFGIYEATSAQIAGMFWIPTGAAYTFNIPPSVPLKDIRGNTITLAQVSAGMGYNAKVVVDLVAKKVTTASVTFTTVSGGAPTVTRFTPAYGAVGTSVTITGTGFSPADNTVNFGTKSISGLSSSGTSITFTVPTEAVPGINMVTVMNASFGISNKLPFVVPSPAPPTGSPKITATSPLVGPRGATVVITGTNFADTDNTVMFGTTAIPNLSSPDHTSVTFVVPVVAPFLLNKVVVTNANGTSNPWVFWVTLQ